MSDIPSRRRGWLLLGFVLYLSLPALAWAEDEVDRLRRRVAELEEELKRRPPDPSSYPTPEQIEFCGELIDLRPTDLRRRFEQELLKIITNRHQVNLYINRATSVFPVIEEVAKEVGTCADLKFVAVVESALKARAVSRAKATGWWQFMPATAKGFQLNMSEDLDERSDLLASTRAALTYLERLHQGFGSWPLAMAGYNTGPGRLKRLAKEQQKKSFWELDLYEEAERYSPRILAMYHVLTHLKEYDFERDLTQGWPQEPLEGIEILLPIRHFQTVSYVMIEEPIKRTRSRGKSKKRRAKARSKKRVKKKVVTISPQIYKVKLAVSLELSTRDLNRFNPHLIGDHLPLGAPFTLYLPPGHFDQVKKILGRHAQLEIKYQNQAARDPKRTEPVREVANPPAPADDLIMVLGGPLSGTYQVREGDRLWEIALRAGVSVDVLRQRNGIGALSVLHVGQRLSLDIK